jgi:hypothetical protein
MDMASLRNLLAQEMAARDRLSAARNVQFASPSHRAAAMQFPGPDQRQRLSFAALQRGGGRGAGGGRTTSGGPGGGYSSRGGGFRGF